MKNVHKINCSKDVSYILEMIRERRGVGPVEFCRSLGIAYNTYYKRLDFGKHHRGYQLDNFINIMDRLGYDVCIIPKEDNLEVLEIELLTDSEQRIFLKAINREREVCQKVDDEYSDDDSKVSLVKVCNSIERKVKKIWE